MTFSTLILYHVWYFFDTNCPLQCKFSCIGASETPCSFLTHNAFRKINYIFPARRQGNTYWKVCHYTNYIINFHYTVQITRLETARNVVWKYTRKLLLLLFWFICLQNAKKNVMVSNLLFHVKNKTFNGWNTQRKLCKTKLYIYHYSISVCIFLQEHSV